MENVMKKVNALYDALVSARNDLAVEAAALDEAKNKVAADERWILEMGSKLNDRDQKIAGVENTAEAKAKVVYDTNQLAKDRAEFESVKSNIQELRVTAEMAANKIIEDAKEVAAKNERQVIALGKERVALKAEKARFDKAVKELKSM